MEECFNTFLLCIFQQIKKIKVMKNVDEVIKTLHECLEFAYKLKFEGENEEQDLGSLLDDIADTFK
jgi:hypothetical protein